MRRVLKWGALALLLAVVGLIAAAWTPDTDAAAMRAKYGTRASQFVDVGGGLTVHLRDEGPRDAPVLVLLHGSNSFLQTWDAWAVQLATRYRVIRLDLPGHGMTGADPKRDYSRAAFVSVVDRVVARLGVARFVLGGNSMGGGVAWAYAYAHPEKLRGLVLIDASGEPEPEQSSPPLGFRLARTPGIRDLMTVITPRSLIADGLRSSVADPARVTDATIDRYWELLRYPGNRRATIDRFATPREGAVTGPLSVPTLILWGANDQLIPVSSAKWFAGQVPGAHTIVYPHVGHLMMEEIPERSAHDLSDWLASLPPAR